MQIEKLICAYNVIQSGWMLFRQSVGIVTLQ